MPLWGIYVNKRVKMMKNLYGILGVSSSASQMEIKRAYRKLAKQYHPDHNPNDNEAAEKFKELAMAYEVVGNENARAKYDEELANPKKQKKDEQGFKNGFAKKKASGGKKPKDINLDFEFENFFGFNPKTKNTNENFSKSKAKNPMDTTNIFNSFFKI